MMKPTFAEALCAREQFEQEYALKQPYSQYVAMCSISRVGVKDEAAPENTRNDICISVCLYEPFPGDVSLPQEYHGIKVFAQVIGEDRPS